MPWAKARLDLVQSVPCCMEYAALGQMFEMLI